MTSISCDVVVVGGGPTGLTVANILGQAGVRTVLVERNTHTVREPRAVSIDDESLRTMQGIGLIDAVIRDAALDYGSHYYTPAGTLFVKVEPITREYGFPRRNAFTQPKLEATLREALSRFGSVAALFGHVCETIAEDANGVSLMLASADGTRLDLRAQYLVGCDGARSAVRQHIGGTLVGSTYEQRWLIVDLASTKERLRQTRVVCNPARPLLTLPGPGGIRRYEFMLNDSETDEAAIAHEFVRSLLAANGPDANEPIVRRQVYAFHARIADRWGTKRIFLAGDAAHLSPPFAGQGMNSGLRDAQNLGWKLAEVTRGRAGSGLLETYEQERKPHAWALIQLAINMGRVMMPSSRLQASMVQLAFRASRLAPRLQSYFAQMQYKPKPYFKAGFVIAEDGGLKVAGRMLPQPRVEAQDRRYVLLDELLDEGFGLVAFGPAAQKALHLASGLDFGLGDLRKLAVLPSVYNPDPDDTSGNATARDVGNALAAFLPPERTTVLLLRPDRYVLGASPADRESLTRLAKQTRALVQNTRTDGSVRVNSPAVAPSPGANSADKTQPSATIPG
jgi:3-(3-hydroxy-phenyl)propionate hydroxylase